MGEKRKSRQEQAAERAEILENLTESEKELYRQRKEFVSFHKNWREFFAAINGEEVKELIVGIFDYESGETPKFKSKMLMPVFSAMIKPVLDRSFADWCYSCHNNANKGGKGGETKAIRKLTLERLIKANNADNIRGVKYADLIKGTGWQELEKKATPEKIAELKKVVDTIYKQCEREYYNEHEN